MAVATFPYLGRNGFVQHFHMPHTVKVYSNLEFRRYVFSYTVHKRLTLQFPQYVDTKINIIKEFILDRWAATTANDFEFFVYNPGETFEMVGSTGKYVGIFEFDDFDIEHDTGCIYNASIDILLLRPAAASAPSELFAPQPAPF